MSSVNPTIAMLSKYIALDVATLDNDYVEFQNIGRLGRIV
jgi:hypothetical protein